MSLFIHSDPEPRQLIFEPRVCVAVRGTCRRRAVATRLLRSVNSLLIEHEPGTPPRWLFWVAGCDFDAAWRAWDETRELEGIDDQDEAVTKALKPRSL